MFKMRKVLSIVLAVTMLAGMSATAMANDIVTTPTLSQRDIQQISEGSIVLGINENISLGTAIPAYYWDGVNFDEIKNSSYTPMISNDDVVGILSTIYPNTTSQTYTIGQQFSDSLNSAIKVYGSDYSLVFNGTQTFYYGNGNAVLLDESTPGLKHSNLVSSGVSSTEEPPVSVVQKSSVQTRETPIRIFHDFSTEDLETSAMKSDIITSDKTLDTTINLNNTYINSRSRTYEILPVGKVNQGNTQLCWAAAAKLTGSYVSGIDPYTIFEIADQLNVGHNNGGEPEDTLAALDLYEVTGKYTEGYYSYQNVKYWIDRDKPIIALAFPNMTDRGHSVTVCGYYNNQDSIIWSETIGNDAEKYLYTTADANGDFTFTSGGVLYTWWYSITV